VESGDYLDLFPGATRAKQRFMEMAAAVVQQVVELQAVVGEINGAFSPESAQGAQLDDLAASMGLSRLDSDAPNPLIPSARMRYLFGLER